MFNDIIASISAAGGRSIIFGGYVRDQFLGYPSKDMDIEVYNLPADKLMDVLSSFGKTNLVGQNFGVIKLKTADGQEYDFSLPRRESKNGYGYKGFITESDPFMSIREAASRRDFTINAIGKDAFTGEIIDEFGGVNDINNRILRATSPKFVEDPLRVLRGVQFSARFGMTMESETEKMCQRLRGEFEYLDKPGRVYPEFKKLALQGLFPNMGFRILIDTQWIGCFPTLKTFKSNDARLFFSNIEALNFLAMLDKKDLTDEEKIALFFATLYQGYTTDVSVLSEMGVYESIQNKVAPLLRIPKYDWTTDEGLKKLAADLEPNTIDGFLTVALVRATLSQDKIRDLSFTAKRFGIYRGRIKPILNGNHLLTNGWSKGPELGAMLKKAYDAQLAGEFHDEASALEWLQKGSL